MKTKLICLLFAIAIPVLAAPPPPTFNLVSRLYFDFTNDQTTVDGFVLFQSSTVSLPLDQWLPILSAAKTNFALPGTNLFLGTVTNVITRTNPATLFFVLAGTNSTWGTNLVGFSNVATNRDVPVGGSNLRAL
jgi:hypothetical protein